MRRARSSRRLSEASTRRWAAELPASFGAAAEHIADEFGAQGLEEGLESAAVHETTEPARLFGRLGRILRSGRRRLLGGGLCFFGFDFLVRGFAVFGLTVSRLQRAALGRGADRIVSDGSHQRTRRAQPGP